MSELAPPLDRDVRRGQWIDDLRRREQQIAILTAQQRLAIAAMIGEDPVGRFQRYLPDELALAWGRSPRQARNRVDEAQAFAAFPAVHQRIADGTWLLDHADAVINELGRCGLDHDHQLQVLELVLSRRGCRTPWELRAAVRTACVVLFPDHAAQRAEKAKVDRDVQVCSDAPGVASLYAHGPAASVAAMMASLDALSWPPAPGDTRTAAQRRFDTLYDLVCGRTQPGQWQAQVLISLATVEGRDELPGEIPGFGPLPAPQAREVVAGADLRRVVVDDNGKLVAVDSHLHRPDLPTAQTSPEPKDYSSTANEPWDSEQDSEQDPDAPSAEDLAWLEDHTDRTQLYAHQDATRARAQAARRAPLTDRQTADPETAAPETAAPQTAAPEIAAPGNADSAAVARETLPYLPGRWSATALIRALHQIRTAPLSGLDLHSDSYAVPKRLKRHLVLRDRTCVFPGCPRRADRCDKDHLIPWPRGSTSEPNLANECKPHHHARHDYFTVTRLPDGTIRWTTPSGASYDRPPRPVLESWAYLPLPDMHFPED